MKKKRNGKHTAITFIPLWLIALCAIICTYFAFPDLSAFGAGIGKYTLAVSCWYFTDKYLIPGVNTREILAKNPIAYAVFILANLLCAAICFGNS